MSETVDLINKIALENKRENPTATVKSCYRWIQRNIKYDVLDSLNPVESYYPDDTILRRSGNCIAISAVFMAILRANGVPCRFRLVQIRPSQSSFMVRTILLGKTDFPHGIVEVYINESWVQLTPIASLRFKADSGLTVLDLKDEMGGPKFTLIEDFGHFDEVPSALVESVGATLHPHLHGKGDFLRRFLARRLTKPRTIRR